MTTEIRALTEVKNYLTSKTSEVDAYDKQDSYLDTANFYAYFKDQVEQLDQTVKLLKALREKLAYVILPQQMDRAGVKTFTMTNGMRMSRTARIMASIPSELKQEAFAYLRENGLGGIVTETVNASTLSAVVKEKMEAGIEFPSEIFKVHMQDNVSLTKAKGA